MEIIHKYKPKLISRALIFFIVIISVTCTKRKNTELEADIEVRSVPSVCIWDKISVRQEPFRNAAVVSNLNLGEVVTYLGVSAEDTSNKNQVYYHIRLSDERVAWVPAFSLVTDAVPAVVMKEIPIYLRPDLLTITDRRLGAMEIIAIIEKSDDWNNFYSEKKIQHGWIKSEAISHNIEDIAFSLFAGRILNEKTSMTLADRIDSILKYNLYPNSVFVALIKEIGEKEKERIQIEEIVKQSFRQNKD